MYPGKTPWTVRSSFVSPVPIPSSAPGDTPRTCVSFNSSWLPLVIGSLLQLAQPAAWDTADDDARNAVLLDVQDLLARFGVAGGCMLLRWSPDDCAIEQSTDDGATWSAIDGWDLASVQGCVLAGLSIRIDSGGDLQWSTDGGSTWTNVDGWPPPAPPNPSSATTTQAACNIATHLAQNIIQGSLKSAVDSFNASIAEAVAASGIIALIPAFGPEIALTIDAAAGLVYLIYHTGSIGDYEAASIDVALATDLQCAIFSEIVADGMVTAGNYAAVATAIHNVSYSPSDVQDAIDNYVSALGLNGMLAAQQLGGLVQGDCNSCSPPTPGSTNCMTFNGTDDYADAAHWAPTPSFCDMTIMWWSYRQTSAQVAPINNGGASMTERDFFARIAAGTTSALTFYRGRDADDHAKAGVTATGTGMNAWIHYAIRWPAGAVGPAIYVNGTSVTVNNPGDVNVGWTNAAKVQIGRENLDSFPMYFQGKMRSIRFYQNNLSDANIYAIASAGVDAAYPLGAPRHWWEGDDGSGGTVHDYGSEPTDLTWHGSGSHWGTT